MITFYNFDILSKESILIINGLNIDFFTKHFHVNMFIA